MSIPFGYHRFLCFLFTGSRPGFSRSVSPLYLIPFPPITGVTLLFPLVPPCFLLLPLVHPLVLRSGFVSSGLCDRQRFSRPPGFTPRFRAPSVVAPSLPSVFVPLQFLPPSVFTPFGPLASPASHCRLCAPRLFRPGYSISRRLRNAWVMVNSSTYSNSSPNPMPRAIEVIFKPG